MVAHVSTNSDIPLEACGVECSEEYPLWGQKYLDELQDPADPNNPANLEKGMKRVIDFIAGWYKYDLSKNGISKESFIEAGEKPIRPSTVEAVADCQELFKALHPETYESETMLLGGIFSGALRTYVRRGLATKSKLNWLWCENSLWCSVYAAYSHKSEFGFDGRDPGRKMVSIPNANHYVCMLALVFTIYILIRPRRSRGKSLPDSLRPYYR